MCPDIKKVSTNLSKVQQLVSNISENKYEEWSVISAENSKALDIIYFQANISSFYYLWQVL